MSAKAGRALHAEAGVLCVEPQRDTTHHPRAGGHTHTQPVPLGCARVPVGSVYRGRPTDTLQVKDSMEYVLCCCRCFFPKGAFAHITKKGQNLTVSCFAGRLPLRTAGEMYMREVCLWSQEPFLFSFFFFSKNGL